MSDFIEAGTCDADGCTNEADARRSAGSAGTKNILSVEIVSDAICPWCHIAKRQFERAAAKLSKDVKLSVHWRPFELNPDMPPEGLDRVAYRSRKFGSSTHSQR